MLSLDMEGVTLNPVAKADSARAQSILDTLSRALLIRSPLVRLNLDRNPADPEIYLKLENLQPIGSFKVRGAAVAMLSGDQNVLMRDGVLTASAGNMGQACAIVARELGIGCTVVVPDSAPKTKLAAIARYGATIVKVPFDSWWSVIEKGLASPVISELGIGGVFVHPVCNQDVMAGHSTIGLEILEDLPDVDTVFVPYGGGGMSCGIGSVMKAARGASCKVYGCEPSTAAPLCSSFEAGERCTLFPGWQPSFVDGCGGKAVIDTMWTVVQQVLDGGKAVSPADIAAAIQLLAERNKVVAEGAGACSVAAALRVPPGGPAKKIVCVVSGGGLDTDKLIAVLAGVRTTSLGSECWRDSRFAASVGVSAVALVGVGAMLGAMLARILAAR